METENILGQLNEPQREAVTSGKTSVMVLAGAGSGKTRVLTHKMCHLIKEEDYKPENILLNLLYGNYS